MRNRRTFGFLAGCIALWAGLGLSGQSVPTQSTQAWTLPQGTAVKDAVRAPTGSRWTTTRRIPRARSSGASV